MRRDHFGGQMDEIGLKISGTLFVIGVMQFIIFLVLRIWFE